MNKYKLCFISIVLLFLSGCASFVAPSYSPDYQTIDTLKKQKLNKATVKTFQPQDPNAEVNKISLRGSSLKATEGSFASYIENAMRSDLTEMGVYDSNSTTSINTTILKNDIDISGLSKGSGLLEVQLTISKDGSNVLDKTYSVTTTFDSAFAGMTAIPIGQKEYPNLVRTLLTKIYKDPEFAEVLK
jgi:hypothetical protein